MNAPNAIHPIARFRATGRTSRAIKAAIDAAKEGRYVFFLTGSTQEVKRSMHVAYEQLIHEYGDRDIRCAVNKLYVPAWEGKNGGGSITFEYIRDVNYDWKSKVVTNAHPSCIAIVDPYAVEAIYDCVIRAYHEYDPTPDQIRTSWEGGFKL